ncbi:hypothetical protein ACT17_14900 [Mycolicibacterium conceptionense]|uniref:Uncharacterized protein n=1 Tax=Mycolicibacterium conceptionense TaxID=451644 RepID=A0A0J8U842_9MYCO|nr:hypothetical protein ACT17_14900 [Mycolicibacterium conceptionense]
MTRGQERDVERVVDDRERHGAAFEPVVLDLLVDRDTRLRVRAIGPAVVVVRLCAFSDRDPRTGGRHGRSRRSGDGCRHCERSGDTDACSHEAASNRKHA